MDFCKETRTMETGSSDRIWTVAELLEAMS